MLFESSRGEKLFNKLQKQINYAASIAINNAVFEARKEVIKEMKRVFDDPTPYTLRAFIVKKANRDFLEATLKAKEPFSEVGKGTAPSKYLFSEVYGGKRGLKSSELQMQEKGILKRGQIYVPGRSQIKNKYGNITGGQTVKIMSALKAHREVGYLANYTKRSIARSKKALNLFAINNPRSHLFPGVYERKRSGGLKLRLLFVKEPTYRKRLKFEEIAQKTFDKVLHKKLDEAIDYVLSTVK